MDSIRALMGLNLIFDLLVFKFNPQSAKDHTGLLFFSVMIGWDCPGARLKLTDIGGSGSRKFFKRGNLLFLAPCVSPAHHFKIKKIYELTIKWDHYKAKTLVLTYRLFRPLQKVCEAENQLCKVCRFL